MLLGKISLKKSILLFVLVLTACVGYADGEDQDFSYEGDWVSNPSNMVDFSDSIFLSVARYEDENHFLVISHSNWNDRFSFVGSGSINENGYLVIETYEGRTWLLTPMNIRGYNEAISITNSRNEESFGSFLRFEDKFTIWPPMKD